MVTINLGLAASMASFLLAAGEKGSRMALPNSRVMIHQPMGGAHGQVSLPPKSASEWKQKPG